MSSIEANSNDSTIHAKHSLAKTNTKAVNHSESAQKANVERPDWLLRRIAVKATHDIGVIIR